MAKVITKSRPKRRGKRDPATAKSSEPKSLAQLNAWMTANYAKLASAARQNSTNLTGKSTFGGSKRRKSA